MNSMLVRIAWIKNKYEMWNQLDVAPIKIRQIKDLKQLKDIENKSLTTSFDTIHYPLSIELNSNDNLMLRPQCTYVSPTDATT